MEDRNSETKDSLIQDFMKDIEGDRLIALIDLTDLEERYKRYISQISLQKIASDSLTGNYAIKTMNKCSPKTNRKADHLQATTQEDHTIENRDSNVEESVLLTISPVKTEPQTDSGNMTCTPSIGGCYLQAGTVHTMNQDDKSEIITNELQHDSKDLLLCYKSELHSQPADNCVNSESYKNVILLNSEGRNTCDSDSVEVPPVEHIKVESVNFFDNDLIECKEDEVIKDVDVKGYLTEDNATCIQHVKHKLVEHVQNDSTGDINDGEMDENVMKCERSCSPVKVLLVCNDSAIEVKSENDVLDVESVCDNDQVMSPDSEQAGVSDNCYFKWLSPVRDQLNNDQVMSEGSEQVGVSDSSYFKWLIPGKDHLNLMSDSDEGAAEIDNNQTDQTWVFTGSPDEVSIQVEERESDSMLSLSHTSLLNQPTPDVSTCTNKQETVIGTASQGDKSPVHPSQQTPAKVGLTTDITDAQSSGDEVIHTTGKKKSSRVLDSDSDSTEERIHTVRKRRKTMNVINSDDSDDEANPKVRQVGMAGTNIRKSIQFDTDKEDNSNTSHNGSIRKKSGRLRVSDDDPGGETEASGGDKQNQVRSDKDNEIPSNVSQTSAGNSEHVCTSQMDTASSDSPDIDSGEVDQSAILSAGEERRGRTVRKRKSLLLKRRINEVKKNWKKRKSFEDNDSKSNRFSVFRRIQTVEDSESSDEDRSDSPVKSDSHSSSDTEIQSPGDIDESVEEEDSLKDFIDSQENETGAPSLATLMPQLQGRMLNLKEAYDYYLATMVNGAIDPECLNQASLEETDDYESVIKPSLQKIDDAITSRLGLAFSSAWKKEYRDALLSRPSMLIRNVDWNDKDCQACERAGHLCSKVCVFSGPLYDRETLVEIPDDDSSSSSSEDFLLERTPTRTKFWTGSFCARRSLSYHQLYHYKFNTLEKCRRKVDLVTMHRLYENEKDIFNQCMTDNSWKEQMFAHLEKVLHFSEIYMNDTKLDFANF